MAEQKKPGLSAFGRPPSAFPGMEVFVVALMADFLFNLFENWVLEREKPTEEGKKEVGKKPPRYPAWGYLKAALILLLVVLVLTKPAEVLGTLCGGLLLIVVIIRLALELPRRQARKEVFRAIRIKGITNADKLAEHIDEVEAFARKNLNPIEDTFVGIEAGRIRDKHRWPNLPVTKTKKGRGRQ